MSLYRFVFIVFLFLMTSACSAKTADEDKHAEKIAHEVNESEKQGEKQREKQEEKKLQAKESPNAILIGSIYEESAHTILNNPVYLAGLEDIQQNKNAIAKGKLLKLLRRSESAELNYQLSLVEQQLGNVELAAEYLKKALSQDLPQFLPAWKHEPALKALRESSVAEQINKLVPDLESAWRAAMKTGIPVLHWLPGDMSDDPYVRPAPATLRTGIYLPESGRFVPLGRPVKNAIYAKFWPERGEVLVVQAERSVGMDSLLNNVSFQLFDALTGERITEATEAPKGYEGPAALELSGNSEGIFVRAINNKTSNPDIAIVSQWQRVSGQLKNAEKLVPQVRVVADGAVLVSSLADPQKKSPDSFFNLQLQHNNNTLLFTTESACKWEGGDEPSPVLRYIVNAPNTEKHKAEFSAGTGSVNAQIVSGYFLLQVKDQLYSSKVTQADVLHSLNPLPSHLVLTPPLFEKSCISM